MALSRDDEQQLLQWVAERNKHPINSDEFYKYRDLIFTNALKKLGDYFFVLKKKWASKYKISAEDSISIIHDGLLIASNKFDPGNYKSPKFVTYLTTILNRLALNYFHRDNLTQKRMEHVIHKMPAACYVSLDNLLSLLDGLHETEPVAPVFQELLNYLVSQTDYSEVNFTEKFFIEQFMTQLNDNDRFMLQSILEGYTLRDIAKRLGLSVAGVRYKLQFLAKKMKRAERV